MIKKYVNKQIVALLATAMIVLTGCGNQASVSDNSASVNEVSENTIVEENEEKELWSMESVMEQVGGEYVNTEDDKAAITALYDTDYKPVDGFDEEIEGVDYGERIQIVYYSTTTERDRQANIILPPGYDENETYPVLYLLHGIGGDESEWFLGSPEEIIGNLVADGEVVPFITVVPNVRARANDHDSSDVYSAGNIEAFNNFINDLKYDLMPYINENFNVYTDREHTAICGLSMGGMESLSIGFQLLDVFGYIGAFSPAPSLDTSLLYVPDGYEAPIYLLICTGDSDSVVFDNPYDYHTVLAANNVEHTFYFVPGGDHNFFVWNEGLYTFVKNIF